MNQKQPGKDLSSKDLIFWSLVISDKANVVTQIPMASKSSLYLCLSLLLGSQSPLSSPLHPVRAECKKNDSF